MATITGTLSETLKVSGVDSALKIQTAIVPELMVASGTLSQKRRVAATVRERLALRPIVIGSGAFGVLIQDMIGLVARLNGGLAAALRDTLRLTHSQRVAQKAALAETLRFALHISIGGVYTAALRSSIRLTDHGARYSIGAFLRERMALAETLARAYRTYADLAEEVRLSGTLDPKLTIVILLRDDLDLSAAMLLHGIYHGTLSDTLDFVIDTLGPSGDVTTWVVNARTGAVTEYMAYDFNSFALGPSGAYLGANASGLYELIGPTDNGDPVIADIVSGLADFSGSFLTGFKAAYLGLRGAGQFYLKLIDGSGKTYIYSVSADNLRTARVNVGKGLRARYFTWELVSTGQAFDLESIEFLPVQSSRRV